MVLHLSTLPFFREGCPKSLMFFFVNTGEDADDVDDDDKKQE